MESTLNEILEHLKREAEERPRPLVQYPAFRHHEKARKEVNDSIMGLLAGAGLASHLLQPMLKADVPLSSIFPHIDEISRFDLSIGKARVILENSGTHVAKMALPYLLAIHEEYVKSSLMLLVREGLVGARNAASTSASKMHSVIEGATSKSFPGDSVSQFHVLREMRNSLIHRGGIIDERLLDEARKLSRGAEAGWRKQTTYVPRHLQEGEALQVKTGDVVLTLAVIKSLARHTNRIVADSLSTSTWVDVALEDINEFGPGVPKSKDERLRKVQGHARHYYSGTYITQEDLDAGLTGLGF